MRLLRRFSYFVAVSAVGISALACPTVGLAQTAVIAQPAAAATATPLPSLPPPPPAPPLDTSEPAGGSGPPSETGGLQHASGGSADGAPYGSGGSIGEFARPSPSRSAAHHRHASLVDSVYGFVDAAEHHEPREYGRYSYVVFLRRDARAMELTRDILQSTAQASTVATPRNELNLIEFPVRRTFWNSTDGKALLDGSTVPALADSVVQKYYDEGFARDVLHAACRDTKIATALCSHGFSQGPYLITFAEPVAERHDAKPPFLVVDLGKISPLGFSYFVDRFKEQALQDELSDRSRIDTFKNRILALVLDLSSWLPGAFSPADVAAEAGA